MSENRKRLMHYAQCSVQKRPKWVKWREFLPDWQAITMTMPASLPDIDQLPRTTASDVKKEGWRKLTRHVKDVGSVAVTNHGEAEVVVLSRDVYIRMVSQLRERKGSAASDLEALRKRFDERLASLMAPGAGDRLRAAMDAPAELNGSVKAGTGH